MSAILKLGSTGSRVTALTGALVERGYLQRRSSLFDHSVLRAVREFQARHVDPRDRPLVVDGIVGPLTKWALQGGRCAGFGSGTPDLDRVPRSGGTTKGRAALRVAISEMVCGSCEEGQNNAGRTVEKYLNGIVAPPANWCAGFVSWCFDQHRDGCPFTYSLGARDIRQQFKRRGWLLEPDDQPQPGDVIVWWRGMKTGWRGHIGLVHHSRDGILYTIEGNKGNFPAAVRGFDYVLSRVDKLLGFGRVPD